MLYGESLALMLAKKMGERFTGRMTGIGVELRRLLLRRDHGWRL